MEIAIIRPEPKNPDDLQHNGEFLPLQWIKTYDRDD